MKPGTPLERLEQLESSIEPIEPIEPLERLAADLRKLAPIGGEALATFAALLQPRTFAAGEWLLEAGQRAQWCCYVVEGLVREFHIEASSANAVRKNAKRTKTKGRAVA